jgi:hypothetical protein
METPGGWTSGNGFDRGYQGSVCTIGSDKNGVGAGGG